MTFTSKILRTLGIKVAGEPVKAPVAAATKPRRKRDPLPFVTPSVTRIDRGWELVLPIEIVSPNRLNRQHRKLERLKRAQKATVAMFIGQAQPYPPRPLVVTLIRIGPRGLDAHDNLRAGFKAVADSIAAALGVDDGDTSKVRWVYEQEKDKAYGVRVKIERAER